MKRIFLGLLAAIISLGLAGVGASAAEEQSLSRAASKGFRKANELTREGEPASALALLNELLEERSEKLSPYELATLLDMRAYVKMQLLDFEGAREDYQAVLDLGALPEDREAWVRRAIEAIDSGELQAEMEAAVAKDKAAGVKMPRKRVAPKFPEKCVKDGAGNYEAYVDLEFDILEDGSIENIRVTEASDECFIEAALKAIEQWEYDPVLEDGEPVRWEGEKTRITFRYIE